MQPLKIIRRIVIAVAALVTLTLVVGLIVGWTFTRKPLPQTSGELALAGLTGKVEVVRDERGIPQIYGDSTTDLAMAQGFVHAQDRFFEMDLRRHITAGRLSELVGEAGFETDRVIRTMGWRRVAEAELPTLKPQTRQYLQAYADGVNAWLRTHSGSDASLEYAVLGLSLPSRPIEDWTPVDSLAWLKAMAWDLRGDYSEELTRARLSGRMPMSQIEQLFPPQDLAARPPILSSDEWQPLVTTTQPRSTIPASLRVAAPAGVPAGAPAAAAPAVAPSAVVPPGSTAAYDRVAQALASIPALMGKGEGIGSNSWVVSGAHTSTGKPLLSNDPHLSPGIPGIWYQVGLHCRTVSSACGLDVSGFSFSGVPGIVIGHNNKIAWGFTNLGPDVTDFALERLNSGSQFLYDGQWKNLTTREETIDIAGAPSRKITVRATENGPIMSDVISAFGDAGERAPVPESAQGAAANYAVSMRWTGLMPMKTADSLLALNLAQNFEEFRAAASDFAVPAQNLIYADTEGHIGYQAPGAIPVRTAAIGTTPGYWPVPGWDSRYAWTGFVPFRELPYALDPDDGVIVTANQAVTASRTPFLTTEFDYGYRGKRIADLLSRQEKLTPDDMADLQMDSRNEFAPVLVKALLEVPLEGDQFTGEARDLLRTWDFTNEAKGKQSAAAAYYNAVWDKLMELLFDDELPPDSVASGGSQYMAAVTALLNDSKSGWWDNKQTANITEGKDEILRQALVQARLELTRSLGKDPGDWTWGALHELALTHQVLGGFSVPAPVRWAFNPDARAVSGTGSVVNATSWDAGEGFTVSAAPSMRMVVDLSDFDQSTWVNQTGNSGHAFSPHYTDQLDAWVEGRQFPWAFTRDAVQAAAEDTLTLQPAN